MKTICLNFNIHRAYRLKKYDFFDIGHNNFYFDDLGTQSGAEKKNMEFVNPMLEMVEDLIEKGKYFTINRARQYGKTTMLQMIRRKLSDRYLVIPLSFEGMDDGAFASHETFVEIFSKMMSRILN